MIGSGVRRYLPHAHSNYGRVISIDSSTSAAGAIGSPTARRAMSSSTSSLHDLPDQRELPLNCAASEPRVKKN